MGLNWTLWAVFGPWWSVNNKKTAVTGWNSAFIRVKIRYPVVDFCRIVKNFQSFCFSRLKSGLRYSKSILLDFESFTEFLQNTNWDRNGSKLKFVTTLFFVMNNKNFLKDDKEPTLHSQWKPRGFYVYHSENTLKPSRNSIKECVGIPCEILNTGEFRIWSLLDRPHSSASTVHFEAYRPPTFSLLNRLLSFLKTVQFLPFRPLKFWFETVQFDVWPSNFSCFDRSV